MKKTIQTLALGVIISGLASCGGSRPVVVVPDIQVPGPDVIDEK